MQIVYAKESFPSMTTKSVFLAGPTPRNGTVSSWRPNALRILDELEYDGIVYVPEARTGGLSSDEYEAQVEWEEAALKRADCIVFWIPRDMETMPALTTNTEWGVWCDSGKVVLGTPFGAEAVKYQQYYARKLHVPQAHTLKETLELALTMVGAGALRTGGECEVPMILWTHRTFQSWVASQKASGNRLDGCDLLWTFRSGAGQGPVFAWIAKVNVYVVQEARNKTNEFVFGRTDVSGMVLYRRPTSSDEEALLQTQVVLVREFRSPVRNHASLVYEPACGSSNDPDEGTMHVALHEAEEEVGIRLSPLRLRRVATRQLAATVSVHQATIYAVELTEDEMTAVLADEGKVRGVEADSERTCVQVVTVKELLATPLADWSTIGMVMSVLFPGRWH